MAEAPWLPWMPEPPSSDDDYLPPEGWDQAAGLPAEEFEEEPEWLEFFAQGPEYEMWASFGSAAATCPCCLGKGWITETLERGKNG